MLQIAISHDDALVCAGDDLLVEQTGFPQGDIRLLALADFRPQGSVGFR